MTWAGSRIILRVPEPLAGPPDDVSLALLVLCVLMVLAHGIVLVDEWKPKLKEDGK
jgi:hypothetical protein